MIGAKWHSTFKMSDCRHISVYPYAVWFKLSERVFILNSKQCLGELV